MGIWQRLRGVEHRQEGSYSDALVALIQSQAGGGSALPGATAALECASGYVSRAFASASVSSSMAAVLDPHILSMIGRALVRQGEFLALIEMTMDDDTPRLLPAASWTVTGGSDPRSWMYQVQAAGPSMQTAVVVPATAVVHIKYQADTTTPWRGVGPIQSASLAGRLSAEVSRALADEAGGPRGSVLPIPNVSGDDPQVDALKADIKGLDGGLAFVESMSNELGTGPTSNSSAGWKTQRIGAEIPAGSIEAAKMAFAEVLSTVGLSVALFDDSQGAGKREAYRQSLHSVIAPLGRLASSELTLKLGTDVVLGWEELSAGDIVGRSRAFRTMVEAGMDLPKAAALSGLLISDPND